jgi:hypothetical protein
MVTSCAVIALMVSACGSGLIPKSQTRLPAFSSGSSPRAGAALYPQPARVVYRLAGSLAPLAAQAPGYQMTGTTTVAQVTRLATALGVSGPVAADANGWVVTDPHHQLSVRRVGGLPWTLTGMGGAAVAGSGCAVALPAAISGAGTGGSSGSPPNQGSAPSNPPSEPPSTLGLPAASSSTPPPTCPSPTTVPGLPSSAEATRLAADALSRAGLDLTGATLHATGGATEWDVTIDPTVGGEPVIADPWSLAVGANGAILSGSGYLGSPQKVGDYQLVGLAIGVQRLEQGVPWTSFGRRGPVPMMGAATSAGGAGPAPATPSPATPSQVGPVTTCGSGRSCADATPPFSAPCPTGSSCPTLPARPTLPAQPVPSTTVATITGAHLALGWWSMSDPATPVVWLLPAYVFELDNASTVAVLAVADRYLAGLSPVTTTTDQKPPPLPPSPSPTPQPAPAGPGPAATPTPATAGG